MGRCASTATRCITPISQLASITFLHTVAGAPIGLLGMGVGGGCGVGIGLGYGFGCAIGAQYINIAPDFAEKKQPKGKSSPNVIQQLQHQLDKLLHKDHADASNT